MSTKWKVNKMVVTNVSPKVTNVHDKCHVKCQAQCYSGDLLLKVSKGMKLVGLEGRTMLQKLGRVHGGENH